MARLFIGLAGQQGFDPVRLPTYVPPACAEPVKIPARPKPSRSDRSQRRHVKQGPASNVHCLAFEDSQVLLSLRMGGSAQRVRTRSPRDESTAGALA